MPFVERRDEDRVARRRWRNTRIAFVALVIANAVGLYLAVSATRSIQHQRVEAIRSSCMDQNARHDRLAVYIAALIARPQPGRTQLPKKERERQAAGFVNALAPHRDCALVVRQLTK